MKTYWLTGVLGALLLVSPYIFNHANNIAALATSVLLGFGVIAASVFEATANDKEQWEYWITGILGIAIIIAPFVFAFSALTSAMWVSVGLGSLIVIVAGVKLLVNAYSTTVRYAR